MRNLLDLEGSQSVHLFRDQLSERFESVRDQQIINKHPAVHDPRQEISSAISRPEVAER
jgi:hypothetical protein